MIQISKLFWELGKEIERLELGLACTVAACDQAREQRDALGDQITAVAAWLTFQLPGTPGYLIRGLSGGPWATAEEAWAALVEHCVGTDKGEDQS